MNALRALSVAMLATLAAGCGTPRLEPGGPAYFPMDRGAGWTYRVHIEVAKSGGGVVTGDATVVASVLDAASRDGVRAALVRNLPTAADVWEGAPAAAKDVTLVCLPGMAYYQVPSEYFARLGARDDVLLGLVDAESEILPCPPVVGRRFGEDAQFARTDRAYAWRVESVERRRLRGIRGVSRWFRREVWSMSLFTLPDELHLDFAPGIGIVGYRYRHHGTPCDTEWRLVEFRARPSADGGAR